MLITDTFMMVNIPKTGSTFAREVVKAIYSNRARLAGDSGGGLVELMFPNVRGPGRPPDQHGMLCQVPTALTRDTVVTIARSPYERLISNYLFRYWALHPPLPAEVIAKHFPNFPDLSLDEYVDLNRLNVARKLGNGNSLEIGNQTIQFLQMFAWDPVRVLGRLSATYLADASYQAGLPKLAFLRNERLREDLADFLRAHGASDDEVSFCRNYPRVNETPALPRRLAWTSYALNYVSRGERLLLRIFSDHGIIYSTPSDGSSAVAAP